MKIKRLTPSNVLLSVLYTGVIWLAVLHGNASVKVMLEIYFSVLTILLGFLLFFVTRKRVLEAGVLISVSRFQFNLLLELIKAIALASMGLDILAAIYFIFGFLVLVKNADIDEWWHK